jgi:hypothetical protein
LLLDRAASRFTLQGVRKDDAVLLLQLGLPWGLLVAEFVQLCDAGDLFFLDGAAVRATD